MEEEWDLATRTLDMVIFMAAMVDMVMEDMEVTEITLNKDGRDMASKAGEATEWRKVVVVAK
jgi:hypothetical protein